MCSSNSALKIFYSTSPRCNTYRVSSALVSMRLRLFLRLGTLVHEVLHPSAEEGRIIVYQNFPHGSPRWVNTE